MKIKVNFETKSIFVSFILMDVIIRKSNFIDACCCTFVAVNEMVSQTERKLKTTARMGVICIYFDVLYITDCDK